MALAFGATVHDGRYTKIFTVTALDNDVMADFPVVFDGAGGRPTAFNAADLRPTGAPLYAVPYRVDTGVGGQQGAGGEFGTHTLTAAGVTVRKLTASGAGANIVTVRVVVSAVPPASR